MIIKKLFICISIFFFFTSLPNYASDPSNLTENEEQSYLLENISVPNLRLSPIRSRYGFGQGDMVFSIGYGIPNLGKAVMKLYETNTGYKASGFGPLHLKGEYGVSNNIGIGLSINHVSYGAEWSAIGFDYELKVRSTSFLIRMNLYFGGNDMIMPYWGIGTGYKMTKWEIISDDDFFDFSASGFPLGFETTFGLRVLPSEFIGGYLEIGIAKAPLQLGVIIAI
ncbi:MAG: hypothetical protein IIA45_03615 [Bacteroidetes bacterium]|nr:hypothetical protein [Bacteroidota bacterium]